IKEHGLAAIEQPELHIHPKLQVELADLFIDAVRRSHAMFLLETHSEHLLLRFLRRIRENNGNSSKFNKDSLAVIYAESSLKGSEYTNLEITEDGDFVEGWPAGFFDERDEELF
ncbi:MAG: AAA family ATPase, partial [Cycloclasticus sp.]